MIVRQTFPVPPGTDARATLDKAFASYRETYGQFDPQLRWTGDNAAEFEFRVGGVRVSGDLELTPSEVRAAISMPILFAPFKSKAMAIVAREVERWSRAP